MMANAVLPRCQIDEWLPKGGPKSCNRESVRKVRSTVEGFERDFWLCRKDAEFVEKYNRNNEFEAIET